MVALTTTATTVIGGVVQPQPANAGKAEMDSYGNLFTPKAEMLTGGSEAARGISTSATTRSKQTQRLKAGQAVQSVYETRFIAYLSRFLLNFDPAANAWWAQQQQQQQGGGGSGGGVVDGSTSWDAIDMGIEKGYNNNNNNKDDDMMFRRRRDAQFKFSEFAESVEVGLADYFVGPYGSYSTLAAAKAGISASDPALSSQPNNNNNQRGILLNNIFDRSSSSSSSSLLNGIFSSSKNNNNNNNKSRPKQQGSSIATSPEKQGVLNLYTLLKARYTSVAAKRQLAILFSFITMRGEEFIQPIQEIRGLLGEADNATVSEINLVRQQFPNNKNEEERSRTSSRRGGGYSIDEPPQISVEAPPALGDDFRPAEIRPIMKPTSRVLRIDVEDPGEGYTSPPQVSIQQNGYTRLCQACAVLNRKGQVSEVLVLDPGYGYGGGRDREEPPKIRIAPPSKNNNNNNRKQNKKTNKGKKNKKDYDDAAGAPTTRPAKAVAYLEYEIVDIEVVSGGNGYIKTEPPTITITPPRTDPDWFIAVQEQPEMRMIPVGEIEPLRAEVNEMRSADGNVIYSATMGGGGGGGRPQPSVVNRALVERLRRDPLELLPSSVVLRRDNYDQTTYRVVGLPPVPPNTKVPSPRYRAYDPIFGGVGLVPVSKVALALSPDEYGRLALSGAVCTVLVRTALNPLELIKTKQQLENDKELFDYARSKVMREVQPDNEGEGGSPAEASRIGISTGSANNTAATCVAVELETTSNVSTDADSPSTEQPNLGIGELIMSLVELRGPLALFQSADITFLASLMFGSFGFGATELFRRSFTEVFFSDVNGSSGGGSEIVLLLAAALATIVTSAAATPFEVLRVKSMILLEPVGWTDVLRRFVDENGGPVKRGKGTREEEEEFSLSDLTPKDVLPLWSGFAPTLSRELPFAIAKFLAFDVLARVITDLINSQTQEGALPVQVGVGPVGLAVSAIAGAVAGVAGAIVSHPADLILTYTSASKSSRGDTEKEQGASESSNSWVAVVQELLSRDGGFANLFLGLPARATFFFLVIGLQFFLYDYVKNVFQVGTDDLSLVLDVFYAVRAGLVDMDS